MSLLNPSEYNQSVNNQLSVTSDNPKKKKILIIILIIFFVLLALGGVIYFVNKNKPELLSKNKKPALTEGISSDTGGESEVEGLVKEVKKIMLLPDETPVVATVSDIEKVKNQDFFAKAKLGDKVLIYMEAKKAILYRPSDRLIVEVGRVNDQMSKGTVAGDNITATEPTPIPETTVFLPKTTPGVSPQPTKVPTPTLFDLSTEY